MTKEQLKGYRSLKLELKNANENNTKSAIKAQIKEIETFVENIDDQTMRQIIKMKFFQNHTNQYIAMMIGKQDEGTIRKKLKKFFENSDFSDSDVL